MGSHPINLGLRFVLELGAGLALAYWGWASFEGILSIILAIGLPLLAATLWGTFAVPGDPSRSGKAPVPVPGIVRLILEVTIFGLAVWAIFAVGLAWVGWIMGGVVAVHYLISYDRVTWLLKQK